MPNSIQSPTSDSVEYSLNAVGTLRLAQVLAERLTITSTDWHRLKANRKARALQQAVAAIVFLLKDEPQEALSRLQQATGWLDRSVTAPPCPTHGEQVRSNPTKAVDPT